MSCARQARGRSSTTSSSPRQTTEREDLALYDAVDRAGNVVLATSETDGRGRTNVLGGDENLAAAGAEAAASNLPTGPGGVFERFPARAVGIDTLGVAGARRAGGPDLKPSDFERGGAWIDYRGGPGTIETVSFSSLVNGKVDPALVRDRVVVVGASAPALQDVHATPAADDQVMSGPEIQANAIWTALHRLPLRTAPWWADILAILALGLAPAIVGLRARPLAVAFVAPLLGLIWLGTAQLVFGAGWMVDMVWPLAALVMGTTGTVAGRYLAELGERRRVSIHNELLERRVRERTEELRETQLEVVRRLALAAESRDGDTGAHIERMSRLCERLALAADWSEADAELLRHASALHDVGKIGIPDRVLLKPGRLDDAEWEVMKIARREGRGVAERLALGPPPARRGHRAHAPRALGRQRLPARAGARGHPAGRADLRDLRRLRRARVAAAVQGPVAGRGRPVRDPQSERPPVRPRARRHLRGARAAVRRAAPVAGLRSGARGLTVRSPAMHRTVNRRPARPALPQSRYAMPADQPTRDRDPPASPRCGLAALAIVALGIAPAHADDDDDEYTGPSVAALQATSVGSTTATLTAKVTARGRSTNYRFDYGPTTSYGQSVAAR